MDIQGAIIKLNEFRFVQIPSTPGQPNTIVLVVEDFEHVGSDGSPTFGDPRYIMNNPGVQSAILTLQSRPAHHSLVDSNFSRNLEAADLLFLESTCTQVYERYQASYPQVIQNFDFIITEDQKKLLDAIDFHRENRLEFFSETELLSESESEEVQVLHSNLSRSPIRFRALNSQENSPGNERSPMRQSPVKERSSPVRERSPDRFSHINSSPVRSSQFGSSPVRSNTLSSPVRMTQTSQPPQTQPLQTQLSQTPTQKQSQESQSPQRYATVDYPDYSAW